MTALSGVADLAEQARARAGRARLIGRLLATEPDAEEARLAAQVPSLASAFSDPRALRADYARVLLREVSCHESVFTTPDAQLGLVPPSLLEAYRRWEYTWEGRWRVAAGDHLGVQLDFYAHLCDAEKDAWAGDRPDRATQAVETQRALLGHHLGSWGPIAADALTVAGEGTAYAVLGRAAAELLAAEAAHLRPASEHPGMPPVAEGLDLDTRVRGPARTTRRLLAPVDCGGYLTTTDIATAARGIGAQWRPSDTRSRLRYVVETAMESGCLDALSGALQPVVAGWAARWKAERDRQPGAARTFEAWRRRAEVTLRFLEQLAATVEPKLPSLLVVNDAAQLATAVAELSAEGYVVTVHPAPAEILGTVDAIVQLDSHGAPGWNKTPPA